MIDLEKLDRVCGGKGSTQEGSDLYRAVTSSIEVQKLSIDLWRARAEDVTIPDAQAATYHECADDLQFANGKCRFCGEQVRGNRDHRCWG